MDAYANEKEFLASLSEKEIANLFDNLKEKYGRDISDRAISIKSLMIVNWQTLMS